MTNCSISAYGILEGKVVGVKKGATTAHVTIDVKGSVITASIRNEAVEDLGLKTGDNAKAIIKASDVLVAVG
jgi:molybdopterin-binding protein